jgi:hypothetical protein
LASFIEAVPKVPRPNALDVEPCASNPMKKSLALPDVMPVTVGTPVEVESAIAGSEESNPLTPETPKAQKAHVWALEDTVTVTVIEPELDLVA